MRSGIGQVKPDEGFGVAGADLGSLFGSQLLIALQPGGEVGHLADMGLGNTHFLLEMTGNIYEKVGTFGAKGEEEDVRRDVWLIASRTELRKREVVTSQRENGIQGSLPGRPVVRMVDKAPFRHIERSRISGDNQVGLDLSYSF